MQYFILRKTKIVDRVEYDVDYKAKKGFKTIDEAISKQVALETLNDEDNVEYIIVNDGTPIERLEDDKEYSQERANHIAKSMDRGEL